jgi:hypothetical protein
MEDIELEKLTRTRSVTLASVAGLTSEVVFPRLISRFIPSKTTKGAQVDG